ncbi:MAG: DUF4397 domain-containing protein [Gammaproteobacteria bacterium]|nr:DUF4397 domain-containing protein [Gammaproteobacteria bacterium]NND46374.1 DUF4397 domain-containing protein [Woeseiaceae bacterium]NNL45621.1 DUF4397 domain-containing protein [Woeseiaceae bacterium]
MKRILILLSCTAALLLGACGKDSSLPQATGKANIRAVNAIQSSPEISFLIEERTAGSATYTEATAPVRYDDLDYTFNFQVFFAGEAALRRIASQFIDVEANRDYTLLISGTVASPTITLWVADERTFDDTDTVFEARFAHAIESRGALDYYFADPTITPALGNQVATLSFGEISAPIDLAGGDFVLTITTENNPTDIVYVSETTPIAAQGAFIFTPFDGGTDISAPVLVRAFNTAGGSSVLRDPRYPPTVQFINASMDLGTTDIYDDEMLAPESLLVAEHAYLGVSDELEIAAEANTFYYTPNGPPTTVLLESDLTASNGNRYRIIAAGVADAFFGIPLVPDRRSVETRVKLLPLQVSNNFDFVDIYAVEAGTSVDDANPVSFGLPTGQPSPPLALAAGSYDIYVTEFTEKVPLAGPYRIDVVLGDVVDLIIVDAVDPSILDVIFLSGGPTS